MDSLKESPVRRTRRTDNRSDGGNLFLQGASISSFHAPRSSSCRQCARAGNFYTPPAPGEFSLYPPATLAVFGYCRTFSVGVLRNQHLIVAPLECPVNAVWLYLLNPNAASNTETRLAVAAFQTPLRRLCRRRQTVCASASTAATRIASLFLFLSPRPT